MPIYSSNGEFLVKYNYKIPPFEQHGYCKIKQNIIRFKISTFKWILQKKVHHFTFYDNQKNILFK